jgi:hypothetical protein
MTTKDKRELSAKAVELRNKILGIREEILSTIVEKVKQIKYKFLEENSGTDTTEGYISLNNGVIHFSHDSDGNLNEVIVGIHTDKPYVQTDVMGQVNEVLFSEVSDLNLIHIISELDHQLENPEFIDIVDENEY